MRKGNGQPGCPFEGLNNVKAQGAYAFRKDAKDAIPGMLSAAHPLATGVYSHRFTFRTV